MYLKNIKLNTDTEISAIEYSVKNKNKKSLKKIIAILSCIAILVTSYSMMLPGLTKRVSEDNDAILSEQGIFEELILSCDENADNFNYVHTHNDYCYNSDGELICNIPERTIHQHNELCYIDEQEYICDTEESTSDTFINNFSEQDEELPPDGEPETVPETEKVINNEEIEQKVPEHQHTSDCIQVKKLLICEETEEVLHEHDENCYSGDELICELPEIKEHQHDISCCTAGEFKYDTETENVIIKTAVPEGQLPATEHKVLLNINEVKINEENAVNYSFLNDELVNNYSFIYLWELNYTSQGEDMTPAGAIDINIEAINKELKNDKNKLYYFDYTDEDMEPHEVIKNEDGTISFYTDNFKYLIIAGVKTSVLSAIKNNISLLTEGGEVSGKYYLDCLADDSTDIGVPYEGYEDSPYTVLKDFKGFWYTNFNPLFDAVEHKEIGGTLYTSDTAKETKHYINAEKWNGKQPFLILGREDDTSALHFNKDDFYLEDFVSLTDENAINVNGTDVHTGAFKIDHWYVEHDNTTSSENFYGRGSKFVIGPNITLENPLTYTQNKDGFYTISNPSDFKWNIYGGSKTNGSNTLVRTNVVVAGGTWSNVYGGGGADNPRGTLIGIRDNAVVKEVHGGSRDASIGTLGNHSTQVTINVYGGIVHEIVGGCEVESATNSVVNDNIVINISGGAINYVYAGHDMFTAFKNNRTNVLNTSYVKGTATINITATGKVKNVYGDEYRNTSFGSTGTRRIKGVTTLNVSADNNFAEMEWFDVVNITGKNTPNSVTVQAQLDPGTKYIGRMQVTDGGVLYLPNGGIINTTQENNVLLESLSDANENYQLNHAWQGEEDINNRNLSTLKINGNCLTVSPSYNYNDIVNTAGLRIYGNVEGYSTLDCSENPVYSDGTNYYYYVVADSSDNGGQAFDAPEDADYIVCFRYLKGGKIGWYLREKPTVVINNNLTRVGNDQHITATVMLNGLAYEWSENISKNRIMSSCKIQTGDINSVINKNITVVDMIDIEHNSNVENILKDAIGCDEGTDTPVNKLSSFDIILHDGISIDGEYYYTEVNYQNITDGNNDIRKGGINDGVLICYDFAGNDNYHENLNYTDSVMTTFPYSDIPQGKDDALLRIYIPEGVTSSLNIDENDNNFKFINNNDNNSLTSIAAVASGFITADTATANSNFGITIAEQDLSEGIIINNLSDTVNLPCVVYSYKYITQEQLSCNDETGLNLILNINNILKDGNKVGSNESVTDISKGELQLKTIPNTVNLKIVQDIVGNTDDTEFPYILTIKTPEGDYFIPEENDNYEINNNLIKFNLKTGESLIINDIPVGSEFNVHETSHTGYNVVVKEGEATIANGDILSEQLNYTKEVVFINMAGFALPSTGGYALQITLIGMVLVILALATLIIYKIKIRRKKYEN